MYFILFDFIIGVYYICLDYNFQHVVIYIFYW